jgi:hypothetical protein
MSEDDTNPNLLRLWIVAKFWPDWTGVEWRSNGVLGLPILDHSNSPHFPGFTFR